MSTEVNVECITVPANADLSTKQFYFVQVNSSGKAAVMAATSLAMHVTADGNRPDGVLYNDPDAADKAATVAVCGVVKVIAGGTVAANGLVTSDNTGKAIAWTTNTLLCGRHMGTASAASGDLIPVKLSLNS